MSDVEAVEEGSTNRLIFDGGRCDVAEDASTNTVIEDDVLDVVGDDVNGTSFTVSAEMVVVSLVPEVRRVSSKSVPSPSSSLMAPARHQQAEGHPQS